MFRSQAFSALVLLACVSTAAFAQDKPAADTLIFSNGDQLTGALVSAADGKIVFKSDMAGTVTVPFDKVKELRSGAKATQFALVRKGVVISKQTPSPQGLVSIADAHVNMATDMPSANAKSTSASASVPVADVSLLVPKSEFDKQVNGHDNFFADWSGAVTGGATLARSTTSSTTLTTGINLVRATPTVPWLPARDRTTLDVTESYGKSTSPGAYPLTSSIFHADAERDQYFKPKFYALADLSFDHNYAQGLQLQQVYGGGVGWTVIKNAVQMLDFKGDVHYEMQAFNSGLINGVVIAQQPSINLVGATFAESYHRTLPRKMVFTESLNVLPAFNVARAYSANATAVLAVPVVKRLSATVSMTDSFLNDPAPPLQKNSYQFVTGVTYTLK